MRIAIQVRANSKSEFIKKVEEDRYLVGVKEPAQQGKANAAIIRALARHFSIPQSHVSIVLGKTAREKIIEIIY
jgi:hypothetical protein